MRNLRNIWKINRALDNGLYAGSGPRSRGVWSTKDYGGYERNLIAAIFLFFFVNDKKYRYFDGNDVSMNVFVG